MYSIRHNRGATLVEVIVGLGLLGTIAVSILLARADLIVQHSRAQRKLAAVAYTDRLLAEWMALPGGVPLNVSAQQIGKETANDEGFSWKTELIESTTRLPGNVQVVRLNVLDQATVSATEPILTIEIVVPGDVSEENVAVSSGP